MGYFQSKEWLIEQIEKDNSIVMVDVRYNLNDEDAGELAYLASHIPGAYYANISHDLSGPVSPDGRGGRHPLPDPHQLAQFIASIGIKPQSTVIGYDDQGGMMASRLRWLLQWVGHRGEIFVLEGGFKGWVQAGLSTTKHVPERIREAQYPLQLQEQIVVDQQYVRSKMGQSGVTIIDSRDGARYRGEVEPIDQKAGHIPTAVNYFWQEGKREDGSWKSKAEQQQRFATIPLHNEVIVYCGSGISATPNVFALQEAGYNNVKLYAGSWSDWSVSPDNPVETSKNE